jgi:hypothetical protein
MARGGNLRRWFIGDRSKGEQVRPARALRATTGRRRACPERAAA